MDRAPVNFRAFIVVAVAVAAAVFCSYAYMFSATLGLISGCLLLCALFACTVIFILKYKNKRVRSAVPTAFFLATVLASCAFGIACSDHDEWKSGQAYGGYGAVSGRVCAVDVRTGDYRFVLEKLRIGGRAVDGLMRITVGAADKNVSEFIECGDTLSFTADVRAVKLSVDGKVNGDNYRTDIRYTANVESEDITVSFGKPSVTEKILNGLRELYTENMGDKYGNIAFSMVTGDKYSLDVGISSYFNASGLGHIMAVSGLHIGFLVVVLSFVMRKIDRRIKFPIIAVVLAAYAMLADFSPSVVRAVIMAYISGVAVLIGSRRDMLSSLLCAFSLILAVKPLYLFDVGFLLSFGAIYGIALFSGSIGRFFEKHGAHGKVAGALGASLAVSIGVAPAQIYYFGIVNSLSCILNVVLLPYISVIFIAVICLTPIAAIPHCGAVLSVCKYSIMPLDYIAYGSSAIPYVRVAVKTTAVVFLCYPVMFCASEYFMIEKGKLAVVSYSAAMCILLCCLCAV